jgi:hypothetical protein
VKPRLLGLMLALLLPLAQAQPAPPKDLPSKPGLIQPAPPRISLGESRVRLVAIVERYSILASSLAREQKLGQDKVYALLLRLQSVTESGGFANLTAGVILETYSLVPLPARWLGKRVSASLVLDALQNGSNPAGKIAWWLEEIKELP